MPSIAWLRRLTLALVGGSIVVACGGSGPSARVRGESIERDAVPTTTTPADPTTSATPTTVFLLPPATEERAAVGPVHDFEGQRFDFGTIHSVRMSGGQQLITFDRMQVVGDDGSRLSGATLFEEPIIVANTDTPFVNQSRAMRTFAVAPDVVIKRLSPDWTCGPEGPAAPAWDEIAFAELVAAGVGADTQNSLTFDQQGQVVQIRLSRGC